MSKLDDLLRIIKQMTGLANSNHVCGLSYSQLFGGGLGDDLWGVFCNNAANFINDDFRYFMTSSTTASTTSFYPAAKDVDPQDLADLIDFLPCETPDAWIKVALQRQDILLINHAYLEKCAARTALNLMFAYPDKPDLQYKMSRLAREELVHFEQVMKIIKKRGMTYRGLKPSRYAGLMNVEIRKPSDERLIDGLIVGALIEARSCERFAKIAPFLDDELAKFYTSLLRSEARHYKDYLTLAQAYSKTPIDDRVEVFRAIEKKAILEEDSQFRFHSGVPAEHLIRPEHFAK